MFILIAMIIFTITFCDEFKNKTLKNIISYGLSREKIFISKLIVESIQAIIIAGISMFIFITYVYYFTEPCSKYSLLVFIIKFLAAIPVCLGALAFINILILLIKNELVMSFSYIAIMIGLPAITLLLHNFVWDKFHYLGDILLTTQINKLLYMQTISFGMLKISLLGIIYMIVFTAIGVRIFKKQEIK